MHVVLLKYFFNCRLSSANNTATDIPQIRGLTLIEISVQSAGLHNRTVSYVNMVYIWCVYCVATDNSSP